jgi:CRP-like cAMP-binding protein
MSTLEILNKIKNKIYNSLNSTPVPEKIPPRNFQALTKGFTDEELTKFSSLGTSINYPAETIIFNENDTIDCFYIIVNGEAEVFKKIVNEYDESHIHVLSKLKVNDVIGDMALIENKPRSASFRASTDLTVLCFELAAIKEDTQLNLQLTHNLACILSERLRYNNDITVKSMEEGLNESISRKALSIFIIAYLWIFCIYTLAFRGLIYLQGQLIEATPLSASILTVFALGVATAMYLVGIPYSRFGITLYDWRRKTVEAVLYSIPFCLIILAIKIGIVYWFPQMGYKHVFSFFGSAFIVSWVDCLLAIFLYILFSPIQEFIARCASQMPLYLFMSGSETFRKWNAIILSNLLFATAHSFLGLLLSAVVFIPGIFWGWLFHKQRSLVGVSVSHIILGVWTLFIVGFERSLGA